jgi:hypothetical protein
LSGNSVFSHVFHVVFTLLSVFANSVIQTFHSQFIPNINVVLITDLKNRDLAACKCVYWYRNINLHIFGGEISLSITNVVA